MKSKLKISRFDKAIHDRQAFSCGHRAMDNWFKSSISDLIKHNRLRVWCATDMDGELAGFYALSAHQINPEIAGGLALKKERHPIPAIYLSAIGVNTKSQGKGIGRALLGHAIDKCVAVASEIGAAAIILDVEKDSQYNRRVKFYTTHGFSFLEGNDQRLFLSINDAKASL